MPARTRGEMDAILMHERANKAYWRTLKLAPDNPERIEAINKLTASRKRLPKDLQDADT